jgi:ABC-type amino acid transport substrate-binding protein
MVETYVPALVTYGSLAVRSADTALLGELQAALEALKADGTLAMLNERWALPPPPF